MSGPFSQAGIHLQALMEFAGEVLMCKSNTMVHLPYRVFLAPVQPVGHHAALAPMHGLPVSENCASASNGVSLLMSRCSHLLAL